MKLKEILRFTCVSLFCILSMAFTAFAGQISLNGEPYSLVNPLKNVSGVTYVSKEDYCKFIKEEIANQDENSFTLSHPSFKFTAGENTVYNTKGQTIAKLANAPFEENGVFYVPLRMPKEIDRNIIMYDTKTGNMDIYDSYELYNNFIDKFKINEYELKSDRLINLDKFISALAKQFDATVAEVDKSAYNNGNGQIVYYAKDMPERQIVVYFENGGISKSKKFTDNEGKGYVQSEVKIEKTSEYVRGAYGDFIVTLYAKDSYDKIADGSIYSTVEYVGNEDYIEAWGSSPCYSMYMYKDGYDSGGGIDDIGILYRWEKGETKTYELKFFGNEPTKKGEYNISGTLDLTDNKNGKPIKIKISKTIELK